MLFQGISCRSQYLSGFPHAFCLSESNALQTSMKPVLLLLLQLLSGCVGTGRSLITEKCHKVKLGCICKWLKYGKKEKLFF